MKMSKSIFAGFLAVTLMASGGTVYANSFDQNDEYANDAHERSYNMEMMNNAHEKGYGISGMINNDDRSNKMNGKRNNRYCNYNMMGYENHGGFQMGYMRGLVHGGLSDRLLPIAGLRKLKLSITQKNTIKPIIRKMEEDKILFEGKMAALKSEIMAAKISYPIDFNKISSYIDKRTQITNGFQKEMLSNFSKIYNSLTPGQKKILTYY
ncbi:MAG: hypothetical protein GXP60_02355 [Epsilonproteobacteria bacterium]|nr:hypothetical protein [Campylobacterota bacterium]